MPQNEYNAYGEQNLESTIGGEILSYLTPGTMIAAYGVTPGLWDTKKGIKVPFIGGNIKKNLSRTGQYLRVSAGHFKRKGLIGGVGASVGLLKNYVGGGFWAGQRTLTKGKTAQSAIEQLQDGLYKNLRSNPAYTKAQAGQKAASIAENYVKNYAPNRRAYQASIRESGIKNGKVGSYKINLKSYGLNYKDFNLAENTRKQLWGKVNKIGPTTAKAAAAGKVFGAAVKLGKAVSVVGAIGLVWDLTQAIMMPVGKAVVNKTSQKLQEYENRFMTETGGQLNIDYLSRGAATERQRAIDAISKAHINGRSAFGNEAAYMHQ